MTGPDPKPRIGVAQCLLDDAVGHDGGRGRNRFLVERLGPYVEWVPICPELAAGLATPRPALRPVDDGDTTHLVNRDGHTGTEDGLARSRPAGLDDLDGLGGLDGLVFRSPTPSCGRNGGCAYGRDDRAQRGDARGAFAADVTTACPGPPVEEEDRLDDASVRERFVERVFAHARMTTLFGAAWRPRDLIAFHARHKLQLLAHDPPRYRDAGRIVAGCADRPPDEVRDAYTGTFTAALAGHATRGRTTNALHHAFGLISAQLQQARRTHTAAIIDAYRARQVPLTVPITLLRHDAAAVGAGYLQEQTFLSPFPDDLGLRCGL